MNTVYILDDDKLFLEQLKLLVEKYFKEKNETYIICTYQTPEEILNISVKSPPPDIIFVDCMLSESSDTIVLKELRKIYSNAICILMSTELNYALDGYDCGATAFLHKPVSMNDLIKRFDKIFAQKEQVGQFCVNTKNQYMTFNYRDIYYFESISAEKSIYIYTTQEKKFRFSGKLDAVSDVLPPSFERCHKSYNINLANIQSVQKSRNGTYFMLKNNSIVPISDTYRTQAISAYLKYNT